MTCLAHWPCCACPHERHAERPDTATKGVRYGRRVLHEIAGRDTKGNALTICGRTLNRLGPEYKEVNPEDVPIGQHCLGCWR